MDKKSRGGAAAMVQNVIMGKNARVTYLSAFLAVLIIVSLFALFFARTSATTSGSSGNANLTIYDDSLPDGSIKLSNYNITFYANYTNSSSSPINQSNGNANCTISYNFTGAYTGSSDMTFNSTNLLWYNNRSFNYKGDHSFLVNCSSTFGNISLADSYTITNTEPLITKTLGGSFIDFDGNTGTNDYWICSEDTICTYNFSNNVSDPDLNDILTYNYTINSNTTLSNFTFNSSTGVLLINITNTNDTGSKQIELNVRDSESPILPGVLRVNITAVNDAPIFTNLNNQSFNSTQFFNYTIYATDEENNTPIDFNITFLNCSVAQWSTRNCSTAAGKELFNSTYYTFNGSAGTINITFTPARNDVGNYTINFTATDSLGALRSQIILFQVLNINNAPVFNYVCDNERNNLTEDSLFNCYVNATDVDETNNLTITATVNENPLLTWFAFNASGTNTLTLPVNVTTGFNASFLANFTPRDEQVGNWSLNFTIYDNGIPVQYVANFTNFTIANINDSVTLQNISDVNVTIITPGVIYINASDDDLLILSSQKGVYNESITFASNLSWVNFTLLSVINNKSGAIINIWPNSSLIGVHNVNISVQDANNYSIDSRVFSITVGNNTAPSWNSSSNYNISMNESSLFTLNLNLSTYATDSNSQDSLNFTFSSSDSFPSFNINKTTGIINFTPDDVDVGFHQVLINATDTKYAVTSQLFNFTVFNRNDNVSITRPLVSTSSNYSIDSSSNINTSEDNYTAITLYAIDNDLLIPNSQKSFYNENLSLNLTIQGVNSSLFTFTLSNPVPGTNISVYQGIFTPNHNDIGRYNITINISDRSNKSSALRINMTIFSLTHAPVIASISGQNISIFERFYYDANSTDVEDVNETSLNLTYTISNLTASGNFLSVTSATSGIIENTSSLTGKGGIWNYSVKVTDSSGLNASANFTLRIYDFPQIISPASGYIFNLAENITSALNFTVNHSVKDALTYKLYINNALRNTTSGNGNATAFLWNFTANFTDETACLAQVNLTLNASNQKLSNTTSWSININNTNSPLSFNSDIADISGGSPSSVVLSSYFRDIDASDSCINQTIGFIATLISGSGITVSVSNWTNASTPSVQFSTTSDASSNYSISAYEYNGSSYSEAILSNATSNNFSVVLTITTTTVNTPSAGGGGGGGSTTTITKPISLKILLPDPVSADKKDRIVLPITLFNNGQDVLNRISLFSSVAINGKIAEDINASFDNSFVNVLGVGEKKNATLTINIDTQLEGLYEITINASVESPKYSDWGKIYLTVKEGATIEKRILFTEQLIVDNPECAEVKELVDEAKKDYSEGDIKSAETKIDEAIAACKRSIEQVNGSRNVLNAFKSNNLLTYTIWASALALVMGFGYYLYYRMKLRKSLLGYD